MNTGFSVSSDIGLAFIREAATKHAFESLGVLAADPNKAAKEVKKIIKNTYRIEYVILRILSFLGRFFEKYKQFRGLMTRACNAGVTQAQRYSKIEQSTKDVLNRVNERRDSINETLSKLQNVVGETWLDYEILIDETDGENIQLLLRAVDRVIAESGSDRREAVLLDTFKNLSPAFKIVSDFVSFVQKNRDCFAELSFEGSDINKISSVVEVCRKSQVFVLGGN